MNAKQCPDCGLLLKQRGKRPYWSCEKCGRQWHKSGMAHLPDAPPEKPKISLPAATKVGRTQLENKSLSVYESGWLYHNVYEIEGHGGRWWLTHGWDQLDKVKVKALLGGNAHSPRWFYPVPKTSPMP